MELSTLFEDAVKIYNNPRAIANIISNDLLRELGTLKRPENGDQVTGDDDMNDLRVSPEQLAELVKMIDDGIISKSIAQTVFIDMFHSGKSAKQIVDEKGLSNNLTDDVLKEACKVAIENNPRAVNEFLGGKDVAINAIKGAVMKATKGKGNPVVIDKLLRELLTQ